MVDQVSNTGETIESVDLRKIREIFSQTKISFLFGAGSSIAAGLPGMQLLTKDILSSRELTDDQKELLISVKDSLGNLENANIEDILSELIDFFSISLRRSNKDQSDGIVSIDGKPFSAQQLDLLINKIKSLISQNIRDKSIEIEVHRKFIRAIHNTLHAGRSKCSVDYYILNYDTIVEDALGLERIKFCDGFNGSVTGWWDSDLFIEDDAMTKVYKLHGSIDWRIVEGYPYPMRIRRGLQTELDHDNVLIYPSSQKYKETQRDPFAKIIKKMHDDLSATGGDELVLGICGYSFGDSHINLEIEDALLKSKGNLTIFAFTSSEQIPSILAKWIDIEEISEQIWIYSPVEIWHGETVKKLSTRQEWWKFEVLTRILGGEL